VSQGKIHLSMKNFRLAEAEFQFALLDMPGDLETTRLIQLARQGKR